LNGNIGGTALPGLNDQIISLAKVFNPEIENEIQITFYSIVAYNYYVLMYKTTTTTQHSILFSRRFGMDGCGLLW